jgi:hypothetical protein
MEPLRSRIKRSLNNHSVFRHGTHTFRYDEMSLTVYSETLRTGLVMQNLLFVQGVNGVNDAAEFIESFLKKV